MTEPHPRTSGLQLLRENPPFRRLWAARAISSVGDSLGLVALILVVLEHTGSPVAVSLLLLAGDFLPSFAGPFGGIIGDRVDRKRVMAVCEVTGGAVFALIALLQPGFGFLLALVAFQGVVRQAFLPASRASVPLLVDEPELATANATIGFGTNGLEVAGPLLASVLLTVVGLRFLLALDAATFLTAGLVLMTLPSLRAASPPAESWLSRPLQGFAQVRQRPLVMAVTVGLFFVVAFNGVDDVALPFLGRRLGAGAPGISLLYAGVGVGLTVCLAVLARWPWPVIAIPLVVAGFALTSAGNLLTGVAWAVAVAFAMQCVRGVGVALQDVGVATLIQRSITSALQARVFGVVYGSVGVAAGVSYLLGGALVGRLGPRVVLIGAGAGGLITTLILCGAITLLSRSGSPRAPWKGPA